MKYRSRKSKSLKRRKKEETPKAINIRNREIMIKSNRMFHKITIGKRYNLLRREIAVVKESLKKTIKMITIL